MSLRTPNPTNNNQAALDLRRIKERLAVLSEQITTGRRIVRLGDDPTGAALIVNFQSSIARNDQYVKQANSAASFLQTTEASLDGVNSAMQRLQELATQAQFDTTGTGGSQAISLEVDGLWNNLLSIANTQEQGKYIFAGTATTTLPFTGTPLTGATYHGDSGIISLDVAISSTVATNIPGDALFSGPGGILTEVKAFRDALTAVPYVLANVQTASNNLQTAYSSKVLNTYTDLGGRQASLDQLKQTVGDFNASMQSIQNSYEAVDYPQAIEDFQLGGIAQQTALNVMGKSNKQNLFDYIS